MQGPAALQAAACRALAGRVCRQPEPQQGSHCPSVDGKDDPQLSSLEASQAVREAPVVTRSIQGSAQLQPLLPSLDGVQAVLKHSASHTKARTSSSDIGSDCGRIPLRTAQVRTESRWVLCFPRVCAARSIGRMCALKAATGSETDGTSLGLAVRACTAGFQRPSHASRGTALLSS